MMESSKENNNALANINKLLEKKYVGCIIAFFPLSLLSKITNAKHTCLFKLVKDPETNRSNILSKNKTKPVTRYDNLLTFRDTNETFELKEHLLKVITIKKLQCCSC